MTISKIMLFYLHPIVTFNVMTIINCYLFFMLIKVRECLQEIEETLRRLYFIMTLKSSFWFLF
jgi:hypothetical protein